MRDLINNWNTGTSRVYKAKTALVLQDKLTKMFYGIKDKYYRKLNDDSGEIRCNCITTAFLALDKYKTTGSSYSYLSAVVKNEIHRSVMIERKYKNNVELTGLNVPVEFEEFDFKKYDRNDVKDFLNNITVEDVINVNNMLLNTDKYWMQSVWKSYYYEKLTYRELSERYKLTTTPLFQVVKKYNSILKKNLIDIAIERFNLRSCS